MRLPESADDRAWTQSSRSTLPKPKGPRSKATSADTSSEHPEIVLGEEGFFDKLYQDRYAIHQRPGTDLPPTCALPSSGCQKA